jgi:hypothetical protein
MQRRAVPHSVAVDHGNGTASTAPRRKPRRRRTNKCSSDCHNTCNDPDLKSLVLIAILTAVLTFSFVSGAVKFYQWVHNLADRQDTYGHRHHHVHNAVVVEEKEDTNADDDYDVLPWNPIYRIPDAMSTVGDRSDAYATLRLHMDEVFPVDPKRSLSQVQELNHLYPVVATHATMGAHHSDQVGEESYDILNCPDVPPAAYPFQWKLVEDLLTNWPVTDVDTTPQKIYQGLCIFDYNTDYDKALTYREAELPFVVVNDPAVARTVERWNIPGYLSQLLGGENVQHRAEHNTNNHFMYHMPKRERRANKHRHHGQEPQWMEKAEQEEHVLEDAKGRVAHLQREDVVPENIRMTYDEWFAKANKTHVGPEEEHWYFRLIGCGYMDTTGGCDQGSSE